MRRIITKKQKEIEKSSRAEPVESAFLSEFHNLRNT